MSGAIRCMRLIACIAALPLGCAPKVDTERPIDTPVEPVGPSYSQLAEIHNQRAGRLQQLYSRGVVEIRWEDDAGRHFEQGNVQLWLSLPFNSAMRIEKLGDVLFWLGSDRGQYWLFDMVSDPTVLYCGLHYEGRTALTHSAIALQPLALLDLMGLAPLPVTDESGEPVPPITLDEDRDAWRVEVAGSGGYIRIFFDRQTLLPSRVESLSAAGAVAAFSDLRRYAPVQMKDSLSVNWPRLPTLADITLPEGDNSLRLALDSPTTIMDDQPLDRVFDFDRLLKALRPDIIDAAIPLDPR